MGRRKSFADALAVAALSDALDCAYPAAYWAEEDRLQHEAEMAAENAWLVAAESAGWQEAHYESLIESGLVARPW